MAEVRAPFSVYEPPVDKTFDPRISWGVPRPHLLHSAPRSALVTKTSHRPRNASPINHVDGVALTHDGAGGGGEDSEGGEDGEELHGLLWM